MANRVSVVQSNSRLHQRPFPKRMSFVLPDAPLSFAQYLSLASFWLRHHAAGWQIFIFIAREAFRPRFTYGQLPQHLNNRGDPPDAEIMYDAGDWWPRLQPFRGMQILRTDDGSSLDMLAASGGFHAAADILWLRAIDDDFRAAISAADDAWCPAFVAGRGRFPTPCFLAGRSGSGTWRENVLNLVGGRGMPIPGDSEVDDDSTMATINPKVFYPWESRTAFRPAPGELPDTCLGMRWGADSPVGHMVNSTLKPERLPEMAKDTAFGQYAMQVFSQL